MPVHGHGHLFEDCVIDARPRVSTRVRVSLYQGLCLYQDMVYGMM